MRFVKSSLILLTLIPLTLACALPVLADDTPAKQYPESGSVLSTVDQHGHFYQVSTDSRIYLLLCDHIHDFQFGQPECKLNGKPIGVRDTVHFRLEGDWAYMPPASGDTEEKLRIITTELKVIPPVPAASSVTLPSLSDDEKKKVAKKQATLPEPAVVIGSGMQVSGQHGVGWSTVPAPAASGPVVATPVTGGPPVTMIPVGPNTGGVVTGVPVTGGPPVTAVPVGGPPPGGGMRVGGSARPEWVHVLRLQTADDIYQLEGSSHAAKIGKKEIDLGEALILRTEKKHAYLTTNPPGPDEPLEFKILSVTAVVKPEVAKPDSASPSGVNEAKDPKPDAPQPQ